MPENVDDGTDLVLGRELHLLPAVPFSLDDWRTRILPFAVVAVLAELSVLLPPGPTSAPDLLISIGLLLAVGAAFWLPWDRLPRWTTVTVPLAYVASVLFLLLATGETSSGIGIVVLSPLLWSCLFHREWESACVILAILLVQVITSIVPVEVSTSVLIRRIAFWAMISVLAAVAIHGLRYRVARAQRERDKLHEQVTLLAVLEDRDRIGRELHASTIHRIMAVSLHLEGVRARSQEPEVAGRIRNAVRELDTTVNDLRSSVFDLRPSEPGA